METATNVPLLSGQKNAHVSEGLQVRVGIPHRTGRLPFHAFNNGYPIMVSANSMWNQRARRFDFPEHTDITECDFAMDSAGFTAMLNWKLKGRQDGIAGVFPWSYTDYVGFAASCGASWWSQPDMCVESELASSEEEILYRIKATATMLEGVLQILYEWQNQLARSAGPMVAANTLIPPTPVVQGWRHDHYKLSMDLLCEVWERWTPWLAMPTLIGVGSVCRRHLKHPEHGLFAVIEALRGHVPQGSRLHLFGVKGDALTTLAQDPLIASTDSMAYDFSARCRARSEQRSNTLVHRCEEMDRWMSDALRRVEMTT